MMMKKIAILWLVAALLTGCKEKFNAPVRAGGNSFLVVEGVLNVGGPTTVRLTRTSPLDQGHNIIPENNSQVTVEGKDNSVATLFDSGDGNYTSPNLNLVSGTEYRLKVTTSNGKQYLSDYVKAKITPEIDSISWARDETGVQLFVNTKDPSNSTRYYRWDYEETWEQHTIYMSSVIVENGTLRTRLPQEDVSVCWESNSSTNVLIGNSISLESDIIHEARLLHIPFFDEKLLFRYSILVRQYALSAEAYDFFELMKKNSEDLGSVFSPLPSEVKGNIYCVNDPTELVVGFVTASSIVEKRKFISRDEIQPWSVPNNCIDRYVPNRPDSIRAALIMGEEPFFYDMFQNAYRFSTPVCVDCTVRGGTTTRPSFW